jgi:His-Xaa-Ser system radical SAM maturase HxsC
MIDLQIPAKFEENIAPFVCRVEKPGAADFGEDGLQLREKTPGGIIGSVHGHKVTFTSHEEGELSGDVLLMLPGRGVATRLIRHKSRHNTFLFTEQCDQLCVMCSQPPKRVNDQWRLPYYKKAVRLADPNIQIGISGGEPTLQRDLFFDLLDDISSARPDISLHILTNGQHFVENDILHLREIHQRASILWGVPLYAPNADIHDRVVFKEGAFEMLMPNFYRLAASKAKIELRTVITALNYPELPKLADFISKNLPFIDVWAIMGLEPTGFAKAFKGDLFVDHSEFFEPLEHALDIACSRRLNTTLYNIPACTVPHSYRPYCADTISDWKKKYLYECDECDYRSACSGFFEWYTDDWKYAGVHPLNKAGGEK